MQHTHTEDDGWMDRQIDRQTDRGMDLPVAPEDPKGGQQVTVPPIQNKAKGSISFLGQGWVRIKGGS